MVARLQCSKNILRVLQYNERKVRLGVAECLGAANFVKDHSKLDVQGKFLHFQRLTLLNQNAQKVAFHLSLNFAPEDRLTNELLVKISREFMVHIGYGQQPYLIYRHDDASHPHLHIVSTSVGPVGKVISVAPNGYFLTNEAVREINEKYGLATRNLLKISDSPVECTSNPQKLQHGKTQTRKGMANALAFVINGYQCTSLDEFNAVLRLYNLQAFRGRPGSRTYELGGLYYRTLDSGGRPTGMPIKASRFPFKATLRYLEEKFEENRQSQVKKLAALQNVLQYQLMTGGQQPLDRLIARLERQSIATVVERDRMQRIRRVSFVDHKSGVVLQPAVSFHCGTAKQHAEIQDEAAHTATMIHTSDRQNQTGTILTIWRLDHQSRILTIYQPESSDVELKTGKALCQQKLLPTLNTS